MEIISAASNWRLVIRRSAGGVTILHAETCDQCAALPEELFGLPVTDLAHHALAANRAAPVGEEVLLTCGSAEGEWSNRELRELTLPSTVRRVGDYAFLNCGKLKTLRFTDDIAFWGGSCFMNCRELDTFHIRRTTAEQGESLAYIADELSRELDVTIQQTDGTMARLIFPEYIELFEENVPNHHFDYNIYGAGYPYHRCFQHKKLQISNYDLLWRGFLRVEHDPVTAVRMAYFRLRCPVELTEECACAYREYLAAHSAEMLAILLKEKDAAGAAFLLRTVELDRAALSDACDLARSMGAPQVLAMLLEEQHKRFPVGRSKCFDL